MTVSAPLCLASALQHDDPFGPDDWINQYVAYTDGILSPPNFRLWAGIAGVAGALERRVWMTNRQGDVYPNLFVLLVGNPSTGKGNAINPIRAFWKNTKDLHLCPVDVTKASLVDEYRQAHAKRSFQYGNQLIEYQSLLIAPRELGSFFSQYDTNFLSVLSDLWDSPPDYTLTRKSKDERVDITNPQVHMLLNSQPDYMSSFFPEEAWGQGFMSRVIMIFSDKEMPIDIFSDEPQLFPMRDRLAARMTAMLKLCGRTTWTDAARAIFQSWIEGGRQPWPEHSKLQHYARRRHLNVLKLSMISAVSRAHSLTVEACDVSRALSWLLEAEVTMPDVFRSMTGRSDNQVMQELHWAMWKRYAKDKKPIHIQWVFSFLKVHVPSEKVEKVAHIAERSGLMIRQPGTEMFIPVTRDQVGME